ncbi:7TM diverse intracellular signaling domain-containing protein [Flavobacterium sp. 7A]|uniref:7TM diverse intracellular signaling domain-containing protein n=1 Tax=Flavobacterium sp. 7A TaxID=2940571 RepID=UPI00222673E1|nr:7TM diverse intracellular signaling domain-containing protein [Flavobacterium sp. 7A]MCW2120014.1 signal transduction histidine kinase/CheY-like chemotaxis protein [Flavobacterium sp. 7A]
MQLFNSKTNCKVILFFIIMFFSSKASAQYIFKKDSLPKEVSLQPYASVVDVGQKKLAIGTIIKTYESLKPNKLKFNTEDLGFSDHYWWGKIALQNATDKNLNYYLETARPITDRVELYIVNKSSGTIIKSVSGDKMRFEERAFANRKTIFKLNIEPNANIDLYLHLKSDGEVIKIPLILSSTDVYNESVALEQFLFVIFYDILSIVSIVYFFFFFALKERNFLYYSFYVFLVAMMQLSLDGYFYKYFDPSGGWASQHSVLIFTILTSVLLGKYSEIFLKINQYNKTICNLFQFTYFLAFSLILFIIFEPIVLPYCYPVAYFLGLIILFLIVSMIVYLIHKKVKVDMFFVSGILFLILGVGVFILNNFGLLPNTFLILNSTKLGIGLEIFFLSLSMANLIRNLKNKKNELIRLALVHSEEMNDLKSYFLSNISHELRIPLNAIMNLTDSISNEVKGEKIKKNCQVIKYSSLSLLSSVNDILEFSKIEKKEIILNKDCFNLLSVINRVKENAIMKAKDKGLEFEFFSRGDFPNLVIGDEMRLTQVINNVISNAIKFTSVGFVKFEVESIQKSETVASIMLTISDTGIGISKDKMSSILDSFIQHNIDNKRKFGGLELDLYIVKNLVEMQGGTIEMKSYINKGTSCIITLDYEIFEEFKVETSMSLPEVYDADGKTILVFEDNSINQIVLKMVLKKRKNTEIIFANNCQDGLDAFKGRTIDIVLMNLKMPSMDGYEATIAIRNGKVGQEHTNIPIIAITADFIEKTKAHVFEKVMNDYLTKTFKENNLYQTIKNHCYISQ